MSNAEAPISITVKTPASSLVTVRANTGEELDQLVATALEAIKAAVQELETAVRGANAGVPANPAVVYAASAFNATVVEQPPFSNSVPAGIGGGRTCNHGKMTALQGPAKTGGIYKGYFCPTPQGATDKCRTQYINKTDPEWNTFVPDRVK